MKFPCWAIFDTSAWGLSLSRLRSWECLTLSCCKEYPGPACWGVSLPCLPFPLLPYRISRKADSGVQTCSLWDTGTRAVPQRAVQSGAGCISLVGTRQSWPASYPCRWQMLGGGSQQETACIPPNPASLQCGPSGSLGSQGPSPTHHGQEGGGWLKDKCITLIGGGLSSCEIEIFPSITLEVLV